MKKTILVPVFLFLALSSAIAQQTELKDIHYSIRSEVPTEIIAAVESDYPGMNIQEHPLFSSLNSMEELKKKKLIKNFSEYYPVYFAVITGKEYEKVANYNKEGRLISSTEKIKNVAVPRAVLITIGTEYDGWLMTKNQVISFTGDKQSSVYYEVWLKNGRKKQKLTIDATGKILVRKRPEY